MILLTVDEIIDIHKKIVGATGGSAELRDRGLLESAVYSAEASFEDVEQYPSIERKGSPSCIWFDRQPCVCGW